MLVAPLLHNPLPTTFVFVTALCALYVVPPSAYPWPFISVAGVAWLALASYLLLAAQLSAYLIAVPPLIAGAYLTYSWPTHEALEQLHNVHNTFEALASRRVSLRGAKNMRELGGLATADGRHRVRVNMLYRSDAMSRLTQADLDAVTERTGGFRLIIDFRDDFERRTAPNKICRTEPEPRIVALPVGDGYSLLIPHDEYRQRFLSGTLPAASAIRDNMNEFVQFLFERHALWTEMFEEILRDNSTPTVVHCMAGKDRTGVACALILLALGVSQETILDDYVASNACNARSFEIRITIIGFCSRFWSTPDHCRALFFNRRETMVNAFAQLERKYGSIDAYLALLISNEQRVRLCNKFLQLTQT